MLVRATRPVRLECVVRGYVFGHGWSEYRETGTIGGQVAPAGLREAAQLPEPLAINSLPRAKGGDLRARRIFRHVSKTAYSTLHPHLHA